MIGKKKEKVSFIKRIDNFLIRILNKISNSRLGLKIKELLDWIFKKIEKSIRFELMVVFGICFLIAFMFYGFANNLLARNETRTILQYDYGSMQSDVERIVENLNSINEYEEMQPTGEARVENSGDNKDEINKIIKETISAKSKVYITDLDGNINYSVNGDIKEKLDIYAVIDKSNSPVEDGGEKILIYPVKIGENRSYLVYSKIPTPYIDYEYYEISNSFLALVLSVLVFISAFIIITNRKMKYIDEIAKGVEVISRGDLSYRIEEKGKDEIKNLAENINTMAEEIELRIYNERKSEKTKSELITNVSHDLRTPLTSVMGYIGLVKDGKYEDDKMMREYLEIAFNKSNQLKELIEDLFEYTKLNNNGITLNKSKVNVIEFLSQLIEEYIPVFEENNLEVVQKIVDEKCMVEMDAGKVVRVFENLFSNAIKYSLKPGQVIISAYENNGYANIVIRNRGEHIPKEKIERLFDRFYRVDEARNSGNKGSGLGLAISKNIVELHGGLIWAECVGNDISFFIKLKTIK
ncbi:ATP-binding protein [Clostridium sp.]|uniref:sensor histidine kinase n=1 Tax=Clostridium sp. TaxID=1506 RepID=UPI003F3735E9